ncbi:hypothetical protein AB0299_18665 [Pseudarthrobacter sp. NPDC080037]
MVTYAEMGADPIAQIWQELRALRSRKPGAASKGDRLATFDAALEQAEQLFMAAGQVGTATQPILLFYGLSQLGRAIAAASPRLSNNEYSLNGHGISDGGQLQGAAEHGLGHLLICGEKRGAFPGVARALDSSSIPKAVPLGDLWELLPYAERFPLPYRGKLRRLDFVPASQYGGEFEGNERAQLQLLPPELQLSVDNLNEVPGDILDKEWQLLKDFLKSYPTLKGWQIPGNIQRIPYGHGMSTSHGPWLSLSLSFEVATDGSEGMPPPERAVAYHGAQYVYPSLDDDGKPAHPFMLWWAVLYPLSRLARYYPNVWMKLTSISSNPHAVAIEFILREAIRAVPEVALRSLKRFA